MATLATIPAAELVHDVCDYCRRPFGRAASAPAICLSCGLENVRPAARQVAMIAPAAEQAVLISPAPRRRAPRKARRS